MVRKASVNKNKAGVKPPPASTGSAARSAAAKSSWVTRRAKKEAEEKKERAAARREARLAKKDEQVSTVKVRKAGTPTYEEFTLKEAIVEIGNQLESVKESLESAHEGNEIREHRITELEVHLDRLKGFVMHVDKRVPEPLRVPDPPVEVRTFQGDAHARRLSYVPLESYRMLQAQLRAAEAEIRHLKEQSDDSDSGSRGQAAFGSTKLWDSRVIPSQYHVRAMLLKNPNWNEVWQSQDGRRIVVAELSNAHIRHILALLIRKRKETKSEFKDMLERVDSVMEEFKSFINDENIHVIRRA
jgi:hypothetical protein